MSILQKMRERLNLVSEHTRKCIQEAAGMVSLDIAVVCHYSTMQD